MDWDDLLQIIKPFPNIESYCCRADDNEETIKKRIANFHKHSEPVVESHGDKCFKVKYKILLFKRLRNQPKNGNI